MAVYTSAVQRKQIWPDDSVVWATREERVNVISWAGEPFGLGQMLLEQFLEDNRTGIAPDGFRVVVWAGDRSGEKLDGSVDAVAVVESLAQDRPAPSPSRPAPSQGRPAPEPPKSSGKSPEKSSERRRWGWFRGRSAE
ncbi:hypothetical protein [Kitasatospora sp. NPDC094011]|uniref:hypothetical protein n=1 Tax=Kitasatospora sp. NPDC094011 TaxID=3364090 RepID=UPI00381F3D5E